MKTHPNYSDGERRHYEQWQKSYPSPPLTPPCMVNLISPVKHGNGGWSGQSIVGNATLADALKSTPADYDLHERDEDDLYICAGENANYPLYAWDWDTHKWEVRPPNPAPKAPPEVRAEENRRKLQESEDAAWASLDWKVQRATHEQSWRQGYQLGWKRHHYTTQTPET